MTYYTRQLHPPPPPKPPKPRKPKAPKPPKPTLTPEERRAAQSAAGKKARGAAKARPSDVARRAVQARWERTRARAQAHEQLLEVARHVGVFLDELDLTGPLAERGRDLADRLFAAVKGVAVNKS